jgi:hypothetical protein
MNLYALHIMHYQKRAPTVVNLAAVRQKFEIPFDDARQTIGLGDGQAEAVLVERGVEAFQNSPSVCDV